MSAVASFQLRTVTNGFFDRSIVEKAMTKETRYVLSKFGAFVRQRARSSLRKAKQKSISEMTPDELLAYRIRATEAKRRGRPRPKRPLASSKPGEPPRSVTGFLKKFLYFAYDAATKTVVIGPARFEGAGGEAPRVLEEGGTVVMFKGRKVVIRPRPYMSPAFQEELPRVPRLWAEAAAKFKAAA